MPRVSVVMPTYNRAHTIQNAIRSVIDQTYKDWELIIVDDGSNDGTKRIVDNFANPRIKYHLIEHCGFVSKVRNYGNKLAQGEIIVVHDSDDQAFPDRLEEIVKAFDETDTDLVYHGMYARFYDPYNKAITRLVKPAQPFSKEHLLNEQYIPGQVAYKREKILETPYDERVRCCDDYQMLLEFCLKNYRFYAIDKNLYDYVDSPDSINISGELGGDRKRDVEVIISILKEKYNITAVAGLLRNTVLKEIVR